MLEPILTFVLIINYMMSVYTVRDFIVVLKCAPFAHKRKGVQPSVVYYYNTVVIYCNIRQNQSPRPIIIDYRSRFTFKKRIFLISLEIYKMRVVKKIDVSNRSLLNRERYII